MEQAVLTSTGHGRSGNSTRTPEQYVDRVGQRCQPKPIPSSAESPLIQNLWKEGLT
jgi:hypothetical protein